MHLLTSPAMATEVVQRTERMTLSAHMLSRARRGVLDMLHTHELCLHALSEPDVHALRLAARHLQPLLQVLHVELPKDRMLAKAIDQVRAVLHHTSALREHQVYRLAVLGLQASAPLRNMLERAAVRKERSAAERLHKQLRKFDRERLVRLAARVWPRTSPAADRRALQRAVMQRRSHMHQRIAALSAEDPNALHKARVAVKRYRYMVETFAPYLPDMKSAQRTALKRHQAQLGRWHDERIMADRLLSEADQLPPAQRRACLELATDKATWCAQEQERLCASLRRVFHPAS